MATEDKRIRIVADASPIRNVRREVVELTGAVTDLDKAFQETADSKSDMQNQQQSRVIPPEQTRPDNQLNRTVDNVRPTRETVTPELNQRAFPTPNSEVEVEKLRVRLNENKQDIQELTERRSGLDTGAPDGLTADTQLKEELRRLKEDNLTLNSQIRDIERAGGGSVNGEQSGAASGRVSSGTSASLIRKTNQLLTSIVGIITGINQTITNPVPTPPVGQPGGTNITPVIPVVPPITAGGGSGRGQVNSGSTSGGGIGGSIARFGTGVNSTLLQPAIESAGKVATARNTYESGAAIVGTVGQAAGATIGSIGNAFGPVGGMIGGILGGAVSGVSKIMSEYAAKAVAKLEEMETNVRGYAQVSGEGMAGAKTTAFKEGTYAAQALGMNAGEYMRERGDLLRSAGGKYLGATEADTRGVNEANSLLAFQKLTGSSSGTMQELQKSMRFAVEGTEKESTSNNSPSGVIRLFTNTMEKMQIPFREIAATIDESLQTFTKTADNILSKAGDFDAGKVSAILASVRLNSGLEGKQLERIQMAATGQGFSKDDVSQALIMRVVREMNPEESYFKIMAKMEDLTKDPETLEKIFEKVEQLSGGNTDQIQNLLSTLLPGISKTDILAVTDGNKKFSDLYNNANGVQPENAVGNEADSQFNKGLGGKNVGLVEAATKEKDNRDAGKGAEMLESLKRIDAAVLKMLGGMDGIADTLKLIAATMDVLKDFFNIDGKEIAKAALKAGLRASPFAGISLLPEISNIITNLVGGKK